MDVLRSLYKWNTYEFLGFASVLDRNIGLSILVDHLEGKVLDIGLHFDIIELATNKTLGTEDAVRVRVSHGKDKIKRWTYVL